MGLITLHIEINVVYLLRDFMSTLFFCFISKYTNVFGS